MVAAITRHDIRWLAPSPLWSRQGVSLAPPRNGSFDQPSILRFDSDLFMDELLALAAHHPQKLGEWIARAETWREPMRKPATASQLKLAEPISQLSISQTRRQAAQAQSLPAVSGIEVQGTGEPKPFKLFQPAHQRFYLVSAALVCRQPGLPDRAVDSGKQEQVGFVIRRYIHGNEDEFSTGNPRAPGGKEYAFVNTGNGYAWEEVADADLDRIQPQEERLPMFGITYDDNNYRRRLFAGVIPVARREAYHGANGVPAQNENGIDANDRDPRRMLFDAEIIAPWKALLEKSLALQDVIADSSNGFQMFNSLDTVDTDGDGITDIREREINALLSAAREQIQTSSWYMLLDMANFLRIYLQDVWQVLVDGSSSAGLDKQAKRELVDWIRTLSLSHTADFLVGTDYTNVKPSLVEALRDIGDFEASLEALEVPFERGSRTIAIDKGWPDFLFPFIDPKGSAAVLAGVPTAIEVAFAYLDDFADVLEEALDPSDKPLPDMGPPPARWNANNAWFVIRCVYERPNCGPFHPETLSHPTEPFQMAPFFEPDAPARPIRIPMPMDISPAGLRKYQRNTSLMISDMLCGKINKIKRITFADLVLSVLPWPFHKDLPNVNDTAPCGSPSNNFGMFCSLSIPIVTLCALILLIIIVALFDMFFRWLPLLFTCFPIPGLSGKNKP